MDLLQLNTLQLKVYPLKTCLQFFLKNKIIMKHLQKKNIVQYQFLMILVKSKKVVYNDYIYYVIYNT